MLDRDFRIGAWLVQPSRNRIDGPDGAATVTLKSMAVLVRLSEAGGNVVPKRTLMDAVWGDAAVTDDVLTQCIVELRKTFRDSASDPQVIETIRRVGFRLIPPVQPTDAPQASAASTAMGAAADPSPGAGPAAGQRSRDMRSRKTLRSARLLGALALAVSAAGLYYLIDPRAPGTPGGEPAFSPPEQSIAVLPFADLTPRADHEWLGDGMAEALLHDLTQHPGLRVTARTSAFAFKGQDVDAREIGRRLNVRTVLEGSVQRDADTLRITAQLVETEAGQHLWSMRYDRPADDIFEIQDEISAAVTAELLETLGPNRAAPAPGTRTTDLSAYDDYLLGRFHLHRRTEESIRTSIEYFERAVAADSEFALAYSGLADALMVLPDYGETLRSGVTGPARRAVERALELAPDLAEAHASLGLLYHIEGREEMADAALERALALNPNYVSANVWRGVSLNARLRWRDALPYLRRALELDPLAPVVTHNLGNVAAIMGHYDEAIAQFERTLELSPAHARAAFHIGTTYHESGALNEAAHWYERTLALGWRDSLTLRELALLYVEMGDDAAADRWLAAAVEASDDIYARYGRKLILMTRGDIDGLYSAALANLERQGEDAYAIADLGLAEAYRGRCESAVSLYERLPRDRERPTPMFEWWDIGYGYSHAVHLLRCYRQTGAVAQSASLRREIDSYLDRLAAQGYAKPGLLYVRAQIAAVSDEPDAAIGHLQQAVDNGWVNYRRARHDPNLTLLARDPRYQSLIDDVARRVAELRSQTPRP